MDASDPIKEMRRFPRYPVDLRIKISFKKDGILQRALVRTLEIATHGISVTSPLPLPLNTQVELEMTLPGSRTPIRVMSFVRYKSGTRYGIEFLSATTAQRDDIAEFGNSRKPVSTADPSLIAMPAAN